MGYRILYLRTVRVRVQLYTTTKVQYTYSRTRMQHYFVGIKYMYVYIQYTYVYNIVRVLISVTRGKKLLPHFKNVHEMHRAQLSDITDFRQRTRKELDAPRKEMHLRQAEISLLRKKLSIVVNAFLAERNKSEERIREVRFYLLRRCCRIRRLVFQLFFLPRSDIVSSDAGLPALACKLVAQPRLQPTVIPCSPFLPRPFAQLARAYKRDLSERDYTLASIKLQMCNYRQHIRVLEMQRSALNDDAENKKAECEILGAQLSEEKYSSSMLKSEIVCLKEALQGAAADLCEADAEVSHLKKNTMSVLEHTKVVESYCPHVKDSTSLSTSRKTSGILFREHFKEEAELNFKDFQSCTGKNHDAPESSKFHKKGIGHQVEEHILTFQGKSSLAHTGLPLAEVELESISYEDAADRVSPLAKSSGIQIIPGQGITTKPLSPHALDYRDMEKAGTAKKVQPAQQASLDDKSVGRNKVVREACLDTCVKEAGCAVKSGLRVPLVGIQELTKGSGPSEATDVSARGGLSKKRRLLGQVPVLGSDTLPSALLYGLGEDFRAPK